MSASELERRDLERRGLDERKLDVLRAIVEDYVSTHEPIGSKTLVERHNLGVSPATIRNDMAVLEEEGYIAQPHTSAGRVPTDKGYRLFVDRLSSVKPLSAAERRAIEHFLNGSVDLDDIVHRTVRLLAQLTRQVAVVQYPSLSRTTVRHLEVLRLADTRLMVVLITDAGRVEQRVVDLRDPMSEADVADLRSLLNQRISGQPLADAAALVGDLADNVDGSRRANVAAVTSTVIDTLVERAEERVVLAGTANLARSVALDFPASIQPVLEVLEEQVVLLRLLGEATVPDTVRVAIGGENPVEQLHTASVVTTGYGADALPWGGIGVVGPTRMDYPATIAAVGAVARYVGKILAEG